MWRSIVGVFCAFIVSFLHHHSKHIGRSRLPFFSFFVTKERFNLYKHSFHQWPLLLLVVPTSFSHAASDRRLHSAWGGSFTDCTVELVQVFFQSLKTAVADPPCFHCVSSDLGKLPESQPTGGALREGDGQRVGESITQRHVVQPRPAAHLHAD